MRIGMTWIGCVLAALTNLPAVELSAADYDVVVYGGTSAGAAAAIQTRRMGKTAILIEPGRHVGGLTSGGLGATDIGNKAAIGGIAREFYRNVKRYYDQPPAWKFEAREAYRSPRQAAGEDTMWTFEPHVAETILRKMLDDDDVPVMFGERLDLKRPVERDGTRVVALRLESGRTVTGRTFIDATYEGDLMAAAGVRFHVGRESNAAYGETLNGVQTARAVHHQMMPGVDPYVVPGDAASGLLPGVHAGPPGEEGSGDALVQAYCFRMCLTDVAENRVPFARPDAYDPLRYELLLRNFEAGQDRVPWAPTMMPNRKTDTNNRDGFSTDNINMNGDWPTGDYAARRRMFDEHLEYQKGLMWTLANHPRVPEAIRREASRWGLCRDEFPEHAGWPHQLYVREGRRMISDYVMTQHHCQGRQVADDSVGLAAYTMDSHNTQRYVDAQGHARNEGDVQVGGFAPYPISYRSLVPSAGECPNLLVPVCLSASHIAYGSIRMEPVFMVLGQSAATAACQAIDAGVAVQAVDYAALERRLLADHQALAWTGRPGAVSVDPARLPGLVVDETKAEREGPWATSQSVSPHVGEGYAHDDNQNKGRCTMRFTVRPEKPGRYELRLGYTAHQNRATAVPVTVTDAAGARTVRVNQRRVPPIDGLFVTLGACTIDESAQIIISNAETDGYVVVDAVQLVPLDR